MGWDRGVALPPGAASAQHPLLCLFAVRASLFYHAMLPKAGLSTAVLSKGRHRGIGSRRRRHTSFATRDGGEAGGSQAGVQEKGWARNAWLPELVLRSVLRDAFSVHLPSLVRWAQAKVRGRRGKDVRSEWVQAINDGQVRTRAELARREGVSRARVTQILGPAH